MMIQRRPQVLKIKWHQRSHHGLTNTPRSKKTEKVAEATTEVTEAEAEGTEDAVAATEEEGMASRCIRTGTIDIKTAIVIEIVKETVIVIEIVLRRP